MRVVGAITRTQFWKRQTTTWSETLAIVIRKFDMMMIAYHALERKFNGKFELDK